MSDNRNRCYQLNIDIQNERLRLDGLQGKLQNILGQINPTLADLERAKTELMLAEANRNLEVGTAFIDRKKPKRSIVGLGSAYLQSISNIHSMKHKMNRLREKYDTLLSDQREYEREVDNSYRKLQSLERSYRDAQC